MFRVWGSRAFVRDISADKLFSRAIPCVFLGFPPDALGWQFYHPTSRRVLPSQDVTIDESVPFYRLFPYCTAPLPPPPLFLALGHPPVDPLHPQGPAPSGASGGAASWGAEPEGVEPGGAESEGAEFGSAEPGGAEPWGAEPGGAEPWCAEPGGAEPRGIVPAGAEPGGAEFEGAESGDAEPRGTTSAQAPACASPRLSPRREPLSREQLREWFAQRTHLRTGAAGAGGSAAGGIGAGGTGATSLGGAGVTAGAGRTRGAGAAGPGGARTRGTGAVGAGGVGGDGAGDPGAGDPGVGGTSAGGAGAGGTGAGDSGAGGTSAGGARAGGDGVGDPGAEGAGAGGTGARDPGAGGAGAGGAGASGPGAGGTVQRRPFFVLPLPLSLPPPDSALRPVLIAELVDFAAACCLEYATSLVAKSESECPPSVGGECALGTDFLQDRQEDFECLAAAVPHLVAMLLAPKGDSDAPDIPTTRSYAKAITGTYVDAVSPPRANIVDGMWIFRVKRPPGSPLVFKARYVARGFRQRQGVDFFQTFSPSPKMTTLWVQLHVAAQRDYELDSLDFGTAFLQGSLHGEI
ncbi:unnamed protein product [Closterium sp. NIES-53]